MRVQGLTAVYQRGVHMKTVFQFRSAFNVTLLLVASVLIQQKCCCSPSPDATGNVCSEATFENVSPSSFAVKTFKDCLDVKGVENRFPTYNAGDKKTEIFGQTFTKYIKDIYNQRNYAKALSQDPTHIIQFFEIGGELNLPSEAFYVGMRLFYNKIKECEIIDASMMIKLLQEMPAMLKRYFGQESVTGDIVADFTAMQKNVENIIIAKCTEKLPDFAEHPQDCTSQIAQELISFYRQQIDDVNRTIQRYEAKERLRCMIIKFIELALGKVMWYPKESNTIWTSFVDFSNQIQGLADHGLINHMDDLDDLHWSLVIRFSFFLDLMGSQLPLSFYEEVEQSLNKKTVFFLEFREQDEGIVTKKDLLLENLALSKIRALAFIKRGIISSPYPS